LQPERPATIRHACTRRRSFFSDVARIGRKSSVGLPASSVSRAPSPKEHAPGAPLGIVHALKATVSTVGRGS
jgi:hypothetical protein